MESNKVIKLDEEKDTGFIVISIVVSLIIIGLWVLSYFCLKDLSETARGTFGDMFGGVNALFSGLALAGIILTILLQRKELRFQREELKETRKEFETQNETLKLQRFENTFFNLLNQHHQIVNAIDLRYYKNKEKEQRGFIRRSEQSNVTSTNEKEVVIINGRDVFRYRYNQMFEDLIENNSKYTEIYLIHYAKAQTDFGHYFRNLYRMIKIVDETDFFYDIKKVSEDEIFKIKYKYTSIIRAQISDYELLWLFYNCLSENGIEKFKIFIEQYALLKNIPLGLLPDQSLKDRYNITAFAIK